MTRRLHPDNPATTGPMVRGPGNRVVLCALDDDYALFSEPQQRVYQLSPISGSIWLGVSAGEPPSRIARFLASETGCRLDEASDYISSCLAEWEKLALLKQGLIEPIRPKSRSDESPESISAPREIYCVAGAMIAISLPDSNAKRAWNAIAGHLRHGHTGVAETEITVGACKDGYWIAHQPGERASFGDPAALAVGLKEAVLHAVLRPRPDWIALHAAVLSSASGAIALAGSSGQGKTTLAALLNASGMSAIADDVALVTAQPPGLRGLAFAFAAKPGSWDLLRTRFPNLNRLPKYRRPDGRTVKYIQPVRSSEQAGAITAIIFPRYSSVTPLRITHVRKLNALVSLLNEAMNASQWLTAKGFVALSTMINDAVVIGMEYDNANTGAEWIKMNLMQDG